VLPAQFTALPSSPVSLKIPRAEHQPANEPVAVDKQPGSVASQPPKAAVNRTNAAPAISGETEVPPASGFARLLQQFTSEDPVAGTSPQPQVLSKPDLSTKPAADASGAAAIATLTERAQPALTALLTLPPISSPSARAKTAAPASRPDAPSEMNKLPASVFVPDPALVPLKITPVGVNSAANSGTDSKAAKIDGILTAPVQNAPAKNPPRAAPAASNDAESNDAAPARLDLAPPSVLEVNIRSEDRSPGVTQAVTTSPEKAQAKSEPPAEEKRDAPATPIQSPAVAATPTTAVASGASGLSVPAVSSPGVAAAAANAPLPPPVSGAPAPPPPQIQTAPPSGRSQSAVTNTPSAALPEPESAKAQTPLRSLALEFTPDGAQDVRVRLSERAGEVHISLHTNDSSLTEKISEGVHELAGSLASAGYDAHAWTPDPNAQRQRNQQEQQQPRQGESSGESSEEFGDFLQQQPDPQEEGS
jgi:hypothetical protein